MHLLSYFIHSVFMGTLILYNTSHPLSPTPRLTYQRDAGGFFGTIASDFLIIMGTFDNYTEAYNKFQREVDETPAENPRLHNLTYAFYDDVQKKLSKLSDFTGESLIPTNTLWSRLYSFASDLPKLYQNLDDLIEISGPNYGQHLFEIQKSLEEMGKKVGNVLATVAGYRTDTNIDEVIRQIEVGASTTDLFNRPGLAHWDRDELVEIVVVLGYQRAGFQKTLSFLLSLSDVPGRVAGLKTLHRILTASGEIYDQGLILVVGIHMWELRSNAEGASAFAEMPTVIRTIFSQGSRFNLCIRGDLYCCIQIVPIYPSIPSLKDLNRVSCLGKSELDYLKLPVNPVHFNTGFQITADQNDAEITLYLEECRDCNCQVTDTMGLTFFCKKNALLPLQSPKWKVVLKRGNGFQLQGVDKTYTTTNGGLFDPQLPTFGKWAGICEKPAKLPKTQVPHRIPCFSDQPQTLYTSRYPPTE